MKIQHVPATIERGEGIVESNFSMDPTAEAFEILSSGLYSNKPLAIVRELSCNAYDSHVAAGKADVPIEIYLPTSMDLNFYVKDYGTGLNDYEVRGGWLHQVTGEKVSVLDQTISDEDMLNAGYIRSTGIYNTYFRSTKTSSDEFIGQLGLGSKSPFSYAGTFNVTTVKDGVKYSYVCFKNEERKPVISLINHSPTEEPNGVMVSIAIRRDDVDKFVQAAKSALMYFDPMPVIKGRSDFAPYEMVHTVKGDTWRIREADYYAHMNGPYVVQGFVAYPIDLELLKENGLSGAAELIASTNIDMYVPIGAVSIAASREALQYDRRTIQNLISAFRHVAGSTRVKFEEGFLECNTELEAGMLHDKYMNTRDASFGRFYAALHKDKPFTWNDQPIKTTIDISLAGLTNVRFSRARAATSQRALATFGYWNPTTPLRANEEAKTVYQLEILANTHFVYCNTDVGTMARLRYWLDTISREGNRDPHLFIVYALEKNDPKAKQQCALIEKQLGVTFTLFTDLAVPPARPRSTSSSSPRIKLTKERRLVWKGFPRRKGRWSYRRKITEYSKRCWDIQDIDLSTGGLYIPINGHSPVPYTNDLEEYLDLAMALGLITTTSLPGMTTEEHKHATEDGTVWTDVFEHIKTTFQAKFGQKHYDVHIRNFLASRLYHLPIDWAKEGVVFNIKQGPLHELHTLLRELHQVSVNVDMVKIQALERFMGISFDAATADTTVKAQRLWKEATTKYPMLMLLESGSARLQGIGAKVTSMLVSEYVNSIERLATTVEVKAQNEEAVVEALAE